MVARKRRKRAARGSGDHWLKEGKDNDYGEQKATADDRGSEKQWRLGNDYAKEGVAGRQQRQCCYAWQRCGRRVGSVKMVVVEGKPGDGSGRWQRHRMKDGDDDNDSDGGIDDDSDCRWQGEQLQNHNKNADDRCYDTNW
ncbi:hypothetical protein GW17_00039061 [Ensete ventricosum]|nr:hypothetical protein GW17_00039061 [Ensete ventricosum]